MTNLGFWRKCISIGFRNSFEFANDWLWVFGIPLATALGSFVAARQGVKVLTTGHEVLDAFIAAFVAFVITWFIAIAYRTLRAAPELYFQEVRRADDLSSRIAPKLKVLYDKDILRVCRELSESDSVEISAEYERFGSISQLT